MPVGRPDFWYGQVLLFEQSPTQGKTDAGPTSDWAYTHNANASAHHAKTVSAEIDHGGVTGLADDDHTQYSLTDGTRAYSGAMLINAEPEAIYIQSGGVSFASWGASLSADRLLLLKTWPDNTVRFRMDLSGNIITVGTVDGVDIAAHAVDASAHHTRYTDAEAQAACWPVFIDRGDPSTPDKDTANWDKDSAWHDWDLSAIVPAGAKAVCITIFMAGTAAALEVWFRKNGNANTWNSGRVITQAAATIYADVIVPVDSNRVIEYWVLDSANWTQLRAVIKGWWK